MKKYEIVPDVNGGYNVTCKEEGVVLHTNLWYDAIVTRNKLNKEAIWDAYPNP